MTVVGSANIPTSPVPTIASITNATTFELSANATGAASNVTLTFGNILVEGEVIDFTALAPSENQLTLTPVRSGATFTDTGINFAVKVFSTQKVVGKQEK